LSSKKRSREVSSGALTPRGVNPEHPATIGGLLRRSVERAPRADAIAMTAETLSYQELDRRSAVMAAALVAAGAGKGTRIALLAPDGILWVTTFLAATRIGALVIAVSTLATAPELAHILRHSDTQILIGVRRFLRHDYAMRLETAFPELTRHGGGPLYLESAPYLRAAWLDDATGLRWASTHAALLDLPAPGAALVAALETEVVASDDAVIIYTSGSSSLPKAVVHSQGTAAQHPVVLARYFKLTPADRMMPLLPAFWVGGLTMLLEVLCTGATLVYPMSPATDDIVAAATQLRVNRVNCWGPQIARIRDALAADGIDPDTFRGLGPHRGPDGQMLPLTHTANMLGMTESFGPHSAEPTGDLLPAQQRGASGRTTSDFERRIVDPETGEVLGVGEIGELQLRHGGLMRGFYKIDDDQVFTRDGFYPTGDSARLDCDGYLFFEGRRSDMMKTGGVNVSRMEVEAALRKLPGIALPIVLPLPDAAAGQIVVAAVVPVQGHALTEATLKAGLRELIASYKIPRRIVVIGEDDVPWTPSNKIKLGEMGKLVAKLIDHGSSAQSAA
jgi:acyl-CoA synthetase (AMP-forming)/AMP-acid ligase II